MSTTEHETIISSLPRFRQWSDSGIGNGPLEFKSSQIRPIHPGAEDLIDAGGFFASLLNALHDSRRRQASRAIHQYRQLIAAPRALPTTGPMFATPFPPKGMTKMTSSDDSRSRSTKSPSWALIAAAIVGFGILHIAGEIIVSRSAPSTASSSTSLSGD